MVRMNPIRRGLNKMRGKREMPKEGPTRLVRLFRQTQQQKRSQTTRRIKSAVLLSKREEIDALIEQACAVQESGERYRMLKSIASELVKQNQTEQAMEVVRLIDDADVKDLALSGIVNFLVAKRRYDQAVKLAFSVASPEYRQDAIDYVLKGYLDDKAFDKAIAFVEGLKDPIEKTHAARLLLNGLLAVHDKAAAEEVRERFSLA